jgi:hypothetical protein
MAVLKVDISESMLLFQLISRRRAGMVGSNLLEVRYLLVLLFFHDGNDTLRLRAELIDLFEMKDVVIE